MATVLRLNACYLGVFVTTCVFLYVIVICTTDDSLYFQNTAPLRLEVLDNQRCLKRKHLVYLKIEKTGSGTVTSFLNEFGRKNNLTFAFPKHGNHFGREPLLPEDMAPITKGKHFDLLTVHSTYNRDTIKKMFPADTLIIGSIREPFAHFLSAFYFFSYPSLVELSVKDSTNETLKIEEFVRHAFRTKFSKSQTNCTPSGDLFFNRISKRFGVAWIHSLDESYVRNYITKVLDEDFDLVLIQEYFDESLILMKRRLCWQISDMIYLSYHVRKPETHHAYTEDIVNQHKRLAVAEYLLYDHFYKKMWKTIRTESEDFFDEVRAFKDINERIRSFCYRRPPEEEILRLPATEWSRSFTINGRRCIEMATELRYFTRSQRAKQLADIKKLQKE